MVNSSKTIDEPRSGRPVKLALILGRPKIAARDIMGSKVVKRAESLAVEPVDWILL